MCTFHQPTGVVPGEPTCPSFALGPLSGCPPRKKGAANRTHAGGSRGLATAPGWDHGLPPQPTTEGCAPRMDEHPDTQFLGDRSRSVTSLQNWMVGDPFWVAMPATLRYVLLVPAPRPATPAGMAEMGGRHAPESVADMSGIRNNRESLIRLRRECGRFPPSTAVCSKSRRTPGRRLAFRGQPLQANTWGWCTRS